MVVTCSANHMKSSRQTPWCATQPLQNPLRSSLDLALRAVSAKKKTRKQSSKYRNKCLLPTKGLSLIFSSKEVDLEVEKLTRLAVFSENMQTSIWAHFDPIMFKNSILYSKNLQKVLLAPWSETTQNFEYISYWTHLFLDVIDKCPIILIYIEFPEMFQMGNHAHFFEIVASYQNAWKFLCSTLK